MRYLIFILAFASAWGQVEDYGRTANAAAIYDLTAAAITRAIKSGASDPATCTSGKDLFINTSSTPVIKLCTATNTWTALGSSSMVYPSAGVAVSTGSAWGSSLTVGTGANNLVQLNGSSQLPAVSAALLTNFPTLNQNTTGTAAGLAAQYIDWNASSGGTSIANKPTLTNGTVTVVSSGNLTSTALVTGGGTQTLQTPAATATMDSSGNISTPGSISTGAGGSTAGAIEFGQGTAPSAGTTSVKLYAPASVTSYVMNLPGAAATGYLYGTNSGGVVTQTFRSIQAGDVPTLNQNTTGTAAALAANGANCSAGSFPLGVDASGAAESCTAVTSVNVTAAQMPALTGDVTTSAGAVATTIANAAVTPAKSSTAMKRDVIGVAVGDPAGSALATGVLGYVVVANACTIAGWDIVVDGGTATVDVWKVGTGTAKPTVSNTITASAKPAISTGTVIHSTTLTGWTTSVTAFDVIGFNLDTVATAKYITVQLFCDRQ